MTAKQMHRLGVIRRDRVCRGPGPHRGDPQAHHIISVQRLHHTRADRLRRGLTNDLLVRYFDRAVADPRNGILLCELCHGKAERHEIPWSSFPPIIRGQLTAFAAAYGFHYCGNGDWRADHQPQAQGVAPSAA